MKRVTQQALGATATSALAVLLALWAPQAGADGAAMPTGTWQGSGRACAGTLDIHRRALNWRTPFSRCLGLPFKFTGLDTRDGTDRALFVMLRTAPACRFASIELLSKPSQGGAPRWEVIGYPSEADRQALRLDNALACPLVQIR